MPSMMIKKVHMIIINETLIHSCSMNEHNELADFCRQTTNKLVSKLLINALRNSSILDYSIENAVYIKIMGAI